MSNLAELIAQKAALEKRIAEAQTHERAAAIAQIKQLMSEHGLTLGDLGLKATQAAKASKAGPRKGSKVPVKFRDPASGNAGVVAACTRSGCRQHWPRAANSATSRSDGAARCSALPSLRACVGMTAAAD